MAFLYHIYFVCEFGNECNVWLSRSVLSCYESAIGCICFSLKWKIRIPGISRHHRTQEPSFNIKSLKNQKSSFIKIVIKNINSSDRTDLVSNSDFSQMNIFFCLHKKCETWIFIFFKFLCFTVCFFFLDHSVCWIDNTYFVS